MNYKEEKLKKGEIVISKEPGNSMTPLIKSKQPVELTPVKLEDVKKGDIVFCRVKGKYYTHLVKATDSKKGCLIGNHHGHINGWTKQVFGKVTRILNT
jgi:SOS-response transcriptional repressor LexA